MKVPVRLIALVLASAPAAVSAQHGGAAPALSTVPPKEVAQYEFLIGEWTLDVQPVVPAIARAIHGTPKYAGTLKAWRALDGWGLETELRTSDESGNPRSFSHVVLTYDATARRWSTSALDVYRSIFTSGTAEWRGSEMATLSRGVDAEGKAYATRSRYYEITPASFRVAQERSANEEKTWTETVRIHAKRVVATVPR